MRKILGLAVVFVFIAAVADATLPVRERCSVKSDEIILAARASLSPEGAQILEKVLSKKSPEEAPAHYNDVFLEPALRTDARQNNLKRIKKFLKEISDKRLVKCHVTGGSRGFKGRGIFNIVYSLEVGTGENVQASVPGKQAEPSSGQYYLRAEKVRPGEKSASGSSKMEIRIKN